MIGLGVGLDYALFIVTRHRAHLADGMDPAESIAKTIATSGKAVAFAGMTVIIALLSLILAGIPIVSALGYSAAIVVAVAVAAAVTLLSALLGLLGPRINSLKIPALHKRVTDDKAHGWRRWAEWISHRPWFALGASLIVLAVLTIPLLRLHLGQPNNGQLPKDTQSRQSYDLLSSGFEPGVNGPLLVAVKLAPAAHPDHAKIQKINTKEQQLERQQSQLETQLSQLRGQQQEIQAAAAAALAPPGQLQQVNAGIQKVEASLRKIPPAERQLANDKQKLQNPASDPRLVKLGNRLAKTKDVKQVSPADVSKSGTAAIITVIPDTAPSDRATQDLVLDLRSTVIPAATKGSGLTAYVGGQTAGYIDLADKISSKLLQVILTVVALSIILLLLAFRSVLVPLKAGLMNLLSIGAAYGVLVFVFQEGHGASLIGLDHPAAIVSYVPLLMFAILFGLSMDYEVFLLSQVKEHFEESRDNRQSVIDGLASTGRVITSAALIMVCVFSSFVLNGDPTVKQFGLGLAVAIAVDATVVRCMMVPAVMVLFRNGNWWLPRWLDRILPDIGIGE
jgi:RND superfamily putative drug exporter